MCRREGTRCITAGLAVWLAVTEGLHDPAWEIFDKVPRPAAPGTRMLRTFSVLMPMSTSLLLLSEVYDRWPAADQPGLIHVRGANGLWCQHGTGATTGMLETAVVSLSWSALPGKPGSGWC